MRIHETAAVTGLTIDAIRYYERQHLLDERHIMRQPNGYRSYTPAAIERLQHLKIQEHTCDAHGQLVAPGTRRQIHDLYL